MRECGFRKRGDGSIPKVKAKEVIQELKDAGFVEVKSGGHHKRGDHHFYKHEDGRTTTVPYARLKDVIQPGTYSAIRRQAKLGK